MPKTITQKPTKVKMGRYIDPKTDFGFKLIFGTKEFLINFLNAVLKIKGGIEDLYYGKTERQGISEDDRGTHYDLYCTTGKGEHVIIEMQHRRQKNYRERALYYASRLIQEQGEKGDEWDFELVPVYSVNVVNFHLTGKTKKLPAGKYEVHKLIDKLTLVFLELPHFNKELHELKDGVEKWMYVIKNMGKLKEMPDIFKNTVFEKMFNKAETAKLPKNKRNEYERSLKKYIDMEALIKELDESKKVIVNFQQVVREKDNEIADLRRRLGLSAKPVRATSVSARKVKKYA